MKLAFKKETDDCDIFSSSLFTAFNNYDIHVELSFLY